MTATTIATLTAQLAALKAEAKVARSTQRATDKAERSEDRELFAQFDKAMKAEFLASDKMAKEVAQQAFAEAKAAAIRDVRAILEGANITLRELRDLLKAG